MPSKKDLKATQRYHQKQLLPKSNFKKTPTTPPPAAPQNKEK
ncbi:hypothetical protein [Rariglobus hedericola]|nr:hypothetical protein [Rariglobus hedericola]